MKLKSRDSVLIITGKDRGKTGKILRINHARSRIVVQGIALQKKHRKATATRPGGIITEEGSIHSSNAKLICPQCTKATRVGHRKTKDGRQERVCKLCKEGVEQAMETAKA